MSNPVPPPGGAYPPPGGSYPPAGQGQPGYPPAGGSYPPPPGQDEYGQGQYGSQPQYGQGQPEYGTQPQYGQAQPQYGQAQPQYGQSQPQYGGQAQPQYGHGQPGYPPAGSSYPPPPGQGQYPHDQYGSGQPGFQQAGSFPPGVGDAAAVPATPSKKGGFGKVVLRIALAIVVAVGVYALKDTLFGGNSAKEAKTGDCIASDKAVSDDKTTNTGAKVVDCSSADAKFSVVARIDGESSVTSKSCDKFFKEKEEFFIYADKASGGYILCLRPKG